MGPFNFRKALVALSCFVLCTLSLFALCSSYGSQPILGPVSLLLKAKLALSKYGARNSFKGLTGIQSHAPADLDVRLDDIAPASSRRGKEARTVKRWKSGAKVSDKFQLEATPLRCKENSSSGLSWSQRNTNTVFNVGSAGAEKLTKDWYAEPVMLRHVNAEAQPSPRFLYWGPEIDHPNAVCSGFNHQASSLACALNEAHATGRSFILPSHICISRLHRGLPHELEDATGVQEGGESLSTRATKMQEGGDKSLGKAKKKSDNLSEYGEVSEGQGAVRAFSHNWAELESLIDVGCVKKLVPVVLNTSTEVRGFLKKWEAQSGASAGVCFNSSSSELELTRNKENSNPNEGVLRQLEIPSEAEALNAISIPERLNGSLGEEVGVSNEKRDSFGSVCIIDETVSSADAAPWNASEMLVRTRPSGIHFPWFEVCKQGGYKKRIWSSKLFPKCAAEPLRKAALEMQARMGDYDAVHVRRGDKLTGTRSRHWPHLALDTSPSAIRARLSELIAAGRSVYVASNEANQSWDLQIDHLKVFRPSDFSDILRPVIRNEYQLYIVEQLVLRGATTFVATFKEDDMLGHNTLHFLAEDPAGGLPRGSKESGHV